MLQKIWQKLDDTMKEKFQGDWGRAAYDEALTVVIMYAAHELLLHKAPPEHHPHINSAWYGSWLPRHPLHPVRKAVQDRIGAVGDATYHPDHNRLHAQFAKIGEKAHAKVLEWADDRDHDHDASSQVKAKWVGQKIDEMDSYLDGFFEPPPRHR